MKARQLYIEKKRNIHVAEVFTVRGMPFTEKIIARMQCDGYSSYSADPYVHKGFIQATICQKNSLKDVLVLKVVIITNLGQRQKLA